MKKALITSTLMLFTISVCYSQADVLIIKLKNSTEEQIELSKIQKITFETFTSVEKEKSSGLRNLEVQGNIPNPFSEQTIIEFEIANSGNVEIIIYDNTGNQVTKLICPDCQQGKNSLAWNCTDKDGMRVNSGVYYYEAHFGKEIQSKKMLLIK